jgi:hypothetical protein
MEHVMTNPLYEHWIEATDPAQGNSGPGGPFPSELAKDRLITQVRDYANRYQNAEAALEMIRSALVDYDGRA